MRLSERVGIHHDCSREDASACIGMATSLGSIFCTVTVGTTGTASSRQGDDDRAVGRHRDKILHYADTGDIGSEDWLDKSDHRSDDTRGSVRMDPNSDDRSAFTVRKRRKSMYAVHAGTCMTKTNDHMRWAVFTRELDKLSAEVCN